MATKTKDFALIPASTPPPSLTSNLIDPPSQGYLLIVVFVIYLVTTTPIVATRMYTRQFINQKLWWDDYSSVLALVGLFAVSGLLFKSLDYGSGIDFWNVSVAHALAFGNIIAKAEIVARVTMFFTKSSILLLYLRTFLPHHSQRSLLYYIIWAVIWFNLLYCIAAIVLTQSFQCQPKNPKPGCVSSNDVFLSASSINIFSDVIMLLIPIVVVWNLQMSTKRKMLILPVFVVGMLAVASSFARLAWVIAKANDTNHTVAGMKVAMLAIAEITIGIIVGCMPVLPTFFRNTFNCKTASHSSKTRHDSYSRASGTFAYRMARPTKGAPTDPYLLSADYKELDDIEHGHNYNGSKGITTTINGGLSDVSIPEQTVEDLYGSPATSALVSKSVQIESHSRDEEVNHVFPQPVHFRK